MTLHSTMFLLKPLPHCACAVCPCPFTFHNVSIKTGTPRQLIPMYHTLHSTMFLLKPNAVSAAENAGSTLHSTMFLLKLVRAAVVLRAGCFTFHNVSIKTFKGF